MASEKTDTLLDRLTFFPAGELIGALTQESASRHHRLCPRQLLGIRLGLCGLRGLGLIDGRYLPRFRNKDKRLLTIVETDGCGADGIAVATGCEVGRRTLRVVDYGKVAATFVNTHTGRAVRVAPSKASRDLAARYSTEASSRWHAYLEAYAIIPDSELFQAVAVELDQPIADILSSPSSRVNCCICGEEILNGREVLRDGLDLCRSCAGESYYRNASQATGIDG